MADEPRSSRSSESRATIDAGLSRFLMRSGIKRSEEAIVKARPAAHQMAANGASPGAIAAMLVTDEATTPGGAMWILCDVLGVTATQALEIVQPLLTPRQQDLFDRMPTAKLEQMVAKVAPL